jgi:hypothetical protein
MQKRETNSPQKEKKKKRKKKKKKKKKTDREMRPTPAPLVSPEPVGPHGVGAEFGAAGYVLLAIAALGLGLALACVHALGRWRLPRRSAGAGGEVLSPTSPPASATASAAASPGGTTVLAAMPPSRLLGAVLVMLAVSLLSRAVLNLCIAFEATGPTFVILLLEFLPVSINDATALLVLNYAATEATAARMQGAKINATTQLLNAQGIEAELSGRLGVAVAATVAFLACSVIGVCVIAADPGNRGYARAFPTAEFFVAGAGLLCPLAAAAHAGAFYSRGFRHAPRPAHLVRIVTVAVAGTVVRAAINLSDGVHHWANDDTAVIAVWVAYFLCVEAALVIDILRYAKLAAAAAERAAAEAGGRRRRARGGGARSTPSAASASASPADQQRHQQRLPRLAKAGTAECVSSTTTTTTTAASASAAAKATAAAAAAAPPRRVSSAAGSSAAGSSCGSETSLLSMPAVIPEARRCRHCHESEVQVLLEPCMHLATCAACADVVDACPVCREPVRASFAVSFE